MSEVVTIDEEGNRNNYDVDENNLEYVKHIVEFKQNPNPLIICIIVITLILLFYYWVLFLLYRKNNISGYWIDQNRNVYYIKDIDCKISIFDNHKVYKGKRNCSLNGDNNIYIKKNNTYHYGVIHNNKIIWGDNYWYRTDNIVIN